MDGIYLQLETDLDSWVGAAALFHLPEKSLKDIWNESRTITPVNTYMPFGADALIRQLQTNSAFKNHLEVQNLDLSRFHEDDGDIFLVSELEEFIREIPGVRPPKIARVFVDEIFNWLETEVDFGNGMAIKDLWDIPSPGAAFDDFGAPRLVNVFQESANYGPCPRVQSLERGHFVGGGLKVIRDFRAFVQNCPLPPTP